MNYNAQKGQKSFKSFDEKQVNSILPKCIPTFVRLDDTKILFKKHWGTFFFFLFDVVFLNV